jgi:hypothetical protein
MLVWLPQEVDAMDRHAVLIGVDGCLQDDELRRARLMLRLSLQAIASAKH